MVSALSFYFFYSSSNPAKAQKNSVKFVLEKNENKQKNRPGLAHSFFWQDGIRANVNGQDVMAPIRSKRKNNFPYGKSDWVGGEIRLIYRKLESNRNWIIKLFWVCSTLFEIEQLADVLKNHLNFFLVVKFVNLRAPRLSSVNLGKSSIVQPFPLESSVVVLLVVRFFNL